MGADIIPEGGDLLALADRVGGNEGGADISAGNEVVDFFVPAGNVVEGFEGREDGDDVSFLVGGLPLGAYEGRVGNNVAAVGGGNEFVPVIAQGVGFDDVGIFFKREMLRREFENSGGFLAHLNFGNPQGGFGNGDGETVNFDTVELLDRNFDGGFDVFKFHAVGDENFKDRVFEFAQEEIGFGKEIAGAAGGVEDCDAGDFALEAE